MNSIKSSLAKIKIQKPKLTKQNGLIAALFILLLAAFVIIYSLNERYKTLESKYKALHKSEDACEQQMKQLTSDCDEQRNRLEKDALDSYNKYTKCNEDNVKLQEIANNKDAVALLAIAGLYKVPNTQDIYIRISGNKVKLLRVTSIDSSLGIDQIDEIDIEIQDITLEQLGSIMLKLTTKEKPLTLKDFGLPDLFTANTTLIVSYNSFMATIAIKNPSVSNSYVSFAKDTAMMNSVINAK